MDTPERIWLQDMGDQITWCDYDVTDDGVEYVKAERIAELEQRYKRQAEAILKFTADVTDDVSAEIEVDPQHGRIVRTRFGKTTVAVYLDGETAVVTKPDGQYGLEVHGPWHEFMPAPYLER